MSLQKFAPIAANEIRPVRGLIARTNGGHRTALLPRQGGSAAPEPSRGSVQAISAQNEFACIGGKR